jgi:hypothetical protein
MVKVLYDDKRHIVCQPNTRENLHRVAELMGLKRHWFHASPYPHYDMPKSWVAPGDFGLRLDEALLGLDCEGIDYEQVSSKQLVQVARETS